MDILLLPFLAGKDCLTRALVTVFLSVPLSSEALDQAEHVLKLCWELQGTSQFLYCHPGNDWTSQPSTDLPIIPQHPSPSPVLGHVLANLSLGNGHLSCF